MHMTRIAQLSTYPTLHPLHGGQIRAHQIALALEAAGHEVVRLPLFCSAHYPDQSEKPVIDLTFGLNKRRYPQVVVIDDMTLSELVATDDQYFAVFAASMEESRPGIVMLEEPWLWPAVRRWLVGRTDPPPVFYNSYNVETRCAGNILADTDYAEAGNIMAEIEALERELVRCAAGVTVTTDSDAETLRAWTDSPVAVARNGTWRGNGLCRTSMVYCPSH